MTYTAEIFSNSIQLAIKERDVKKLMQSLFNGYDNLGEDIVGDILTSQVQLETDWGLTLDDICFYWQTLNNQLENNGAGPVIEEKAKQYLTNEFLSLGLEIGKDFSFIDNKVFLSDKAMEMMKDKLPEEVYDYLVLNSYNPAWSLETIENNIGLPGYFERMIKIVQERMDLYAEEGQFKLAADYLWYLMEGTCKKLPMLENTDFVSHLFAATVQPIHQDAVMEWVDERQKFELDHSVLGVLMEDLISATGARDSSATYLAEDGNVVFSKDQLKALNLVWETLGDIPLREIIADL
jgi:hypothetical protein